MNIILPMMSAYYRSAARCIKHRIDFPTEALWRRAQSRWSLTALAGVCCRNQRTRWWAAFLYVHTGAIVPINYTVKRKRLPMQKLHLNKPITRFICSRKIQSKHIASEQKKPGTYISVTAHGSRKFTPKPL